MKTGRKRRDIERWRQTERESKKQRVRDTEEINLGSVATLLSGVWI